VLREIAEYPNSFGPLGPNDERLETDRFTLCMGAGRRWNTVQRQHFRADEIDEVVEEVRSLLRARGRDSTQWEIGSAARPPALVELLLERGLVWDKDPFAVALVLTAEPAPALPGIIARRVDTFDDFAAAVAVQAEAFGEPENEIAESRATLADRWRHTPNIMHAAWLDGVIVSAGSCAPTRQGLLLYGGATLPRARGRGAYRALLRARWDEAAARGTPALMTQASAMSRPILERLGFKPVGHVNMLLDEFGVADEASSCS
jgi:GNAT superfamily N-acetyltransferase